MRPIFYLFIILIFSLNSCDPQHPKISMDSKISMVGKWHRWSKENGYSEFEIDSHYVVVFSEKNGKSRLEYKIENDSFKYVTIKYSAKVIPWGDSMIVLRKGNDVATLHRFDESIDTFERAPDEKDSLLYNTYKENFYKRADEAWNLAGFPKGPGENNDTILNIQ
jgi:hypothetical protein